MPDMGFYEERQQRQQHFHVYDYGHFSPDTTLSSSRNATAASPVTTADKKKTKGAWWRNDEDQLLVQAYLLANKDEKVGFNQDFKPFWQRVFEEFQKGGNDKNRTPENCQDVGKSSARES
ncbi:hypothetical protein BDB00DRAFT_880629 [Zychaea mexicana]|uniref:uncharacterized protein n=1 Tax=Zychaea mexicana TaxID=64656 RepID=UPI0022FE3FF0|nr:uncharacterized protein BDB00DRAFT_880629 [Zychaea mexicana]KAI9466483.1 hypothetical protein BDB00DRAFT_880629 [Zychaea mexicana]